jgi:hypothetical protein
MTTPDMSSVDTSPPSNVGPDISIALSLLLGAISIIDALGAALSDGR